MTDEPVKNFDINQDESADDTLLDDQSTVSDDVEDNAAASDPASSAGVPPDDATDNLAVTSDSAGVPSGDGGADDTSSSGAVKDTEDWVTGDEPITPSQKSYIDTMATQAGESIETNEMTKAEASDTIEELQERVHDEQP